MANTYPTQQFPLGSTEVTVLFNNASNLDDAMHTPDPNWTDRFGLMRQSWSGIEKLVMDFLASMGFEATHLVYVDGTPLSVLRPTQLIDRAGSVYKVKMPATFPVNLTGAWATDQLLLVDVGDASLRAALAASTGATLIGTDGYLTLQENLDVLAGANFVTPEQFNALPGIVADNSVAVQDAITFAENNGGFLWFPRKYNCGTTTMEQTKRLTVRGTGKYNCGIISGASPAWHCTPPFAGASNTDWSWRDIGIQPSAPGVGTYGLHIQLQASGPGVCFIADSKVTDCLIGDFGLQGLYLDNSVANTDGFFTSQFEYNTIVNGILGAKVGDSLTFAHNKIYGRNCGIQMDGVPGARQMVIEDNNITTTGGLLALLNVEEPVARDNQLEHPGYLSGYTGAFGAGVLLFNCYKPTFDGNTINPDNGAATAPVAPGIPASCISLTGTTSFATFTNNDIQKGSAAHIDISTSSVTDTMIDDRNTYYGALPIINNAGTRTVLPTLRGAVPYGATISVGVVAGATISVPGATAGGYVQVEYTSNSQGLSLRGWVSGSGIVSVRLENDGVLPITLSGGNLICKVSY